MNHCDSDHEQIMEELKKIHDRMDKDQVKIDATFKDFDSRQYLWNILKGLGIAGILAKAFLG